MNPAPELSAPRSWKDLIPWWLLLPIACQAAFAWIGFSPTDDGWLQAVARRLLDGEVPHRDFIFLRPALSAYLQVPLVWLGGDYLIWWSRLWGWVTLAATTWLWTGVVGLKNGPRVIAYVTATLLAAHTFPVMAWHTLDGLLLCSAAVVLAHRRRMRTAFFLVGCAALCRQNFAFFAPLLLVAVGGPPRFWLIAGFWSALPAVLYLAGLSFVGAADDFLQQLTASGGALMEAAITRPAGKIWLWGGIAFGGAAALLARQRPNAGPVLLAGSLGLAAFQLAAGPAFIKAGAFQLLGACVAWSFVGRERFLGVTAIALAWVTLISMGYDTPILAAAPILLVLAKLAMPPAATPPSRFAMIAVLAACVAVVAATIWARLRYPYGDAPAWQLTWNVGEALPGASGLRTNPRTIATLADLRTLALDREQRGVPYVVLTDFSAHWIKSAQRNLLVVEWPQETEIGPTGPVRDRFFAALRDLPPETEIFVQKFFAPGLGWGLLPIDPSWRFYHVQNSVRTSWVKHSETRFFEVFRQPPRSPPAQSAVR